MTISSINFLKTTDFYQKNFVRQEPETVPVTSRESKARQYAVDLLDQARPFSAHSTDLFKLRHEILSGGYISPQDRMSLDGVTAEYVSQMSDKEYLDALTTEGTRYSMQATLLQNEARAILSPSDFIDQRPSFTVSEAKGQLSDYATSLSGAMNTRNMFETYMTSDTVRQYLVDRFGEDGAKAAIDAAKQGAEAQEVLIDYAIRMMNTLFSFGGAEIASRGEDGMWGYNAVTGAYLGEGGAYFDFSIGSEGQIIAD